MTRWMKPVRALWERAFAALPGVAVALARWLYFWGLVARSYLVRRGALTRAQPAASHKPMPTAPAMSARAKPLPAAAVGRA